MEDLHISTIPMGEGSRDGGDWRPKAGEGPVEPELVIKETVPQAIARIMKEIAEAEKQGNKEAAKEMREELRALEDEANKK